MKLLEIYNKLCELGNLRFLQSGSIIPIRCSVPQEELEAKVEEMQRVHTRWSEHVSEICAQYPWLLFFSIPKILLIYKLILNASSVEVVHEVSFLDHDRGSLEIKVQVNSIGYQIAT